MNSGETGFRPEGVEVSPFDKARRDIEEAQRDNEALHILMAEAENGR